MARIVIFTYDQSLDRRAVLQCKSLMARGHEVVLYALAADYAVDDAPFVKRVGAASAHTPAKLPFALHAKKLLGKHMPHLFHTALPVLRKLYWGGFGCPKRLYVGLFAPILADIGKADMFMAHDLPMLPVAVQAARMHGGVVAYDSHELFSEQQFSAREKRMWRTLEAAYIHEAKLVMTINPSIAHVLQERYGLAQVHVVHNAEWITEQEPVNTKRFHAMFGLLPEVKIVLYQGGLSHGRNLMVLVDAMAHIADANIHLVVLGSGAAGNRMQKRAAQLQLTHRIHFHEAVPQETLLSYTACADIGIIPYADNCLNNRYCTPNKLFEFIAAGLPIIATNLPEIARIITTHALGEVGDTGNAAPIAAMCERALHPATHATLRSNALKARLVVNWQQESRHFCEAVEAVL